MRPGDWTKNVFVLPAFVFSLPGFLAESKPITEPVVGTVIGFVTFCLIASGFYALNDVLDAAKDRLHPVKRRRPVASGEVAPAAALALSATLIAASFIIAAMYRPSLALVLVGYAVLQAGYNLGIKRIMFVDVVGLATGFALRATAGAAAIHVQISVWLLLCVFFLCLYLGFIKRLCDLSSAELEGNTEWTSPAGYDDRIELNWLLGVSAVLAMVTYLMYALSDHARLLFQSRAIGFALLSPIVLIVIHRFYRRASRGRSDSPLDALREDRVVVISIVLFSVGVLATLFVPGVQQVLEALFVAGAEAPGGGAAP